MGIPFPAGKNFDNSEGQNVSIFALNAITAIEYFFDLEAMMEYINIDLVMNSVITIQQIVYFVVYHTATYCLYCLYILM